MIPNREEHVNCMTPTIAEAGDLIGPRDDAGVFVALYLSLHECDDVQISRQLFGDDLLWLNVGMLAPEVIQESVEGSVVILAPMP